MRRSRRVVRNGRGATALEYALIVATLSIAAIVALNAVGQGAVNTLGVATNAMV